MIGVSVATFQTWEHGRRTPDGPALAILRALPGTRGPLLKRSTKRSGAPPDEAADCIRHDEAA